MDEGSYFTDLIEGDYVETVEGLLFTVKGLSHPTGRIIAYLRYIPDEGGDRKRLGKRYRRVYDLKETTEFLIEHFPKYVSYVERLGMTLQTVPWDQVAIIYRSRKRLQGLMADPKGELEKTVAIFTSTLSSKSGVALKNFGVSGSILIDLASSDSDIDIAVYGEDAGEKIYTALKFLRGTQTWISPYDDVSIRNVLKTRWGGIGLELDKLLNIELNKVLHGLVKGREYFVRLIRNPEEVEAEIRSKPLGEVRIRAVISDACESIFIPCRYRIKNCSLLEASMDGDVSELVSFRGRFTEQVGEGDTVYARGTLEEVDYGDKSIYRVILGLRGDYLVPFKV